MIIIIIIIMKEYVTEIQTLKLIRKKKKKKKKNNNNNRKKREKCLEISHCSHWILLKKKKTTKKARPRQPQWRLFLLTAERQCQVCTSSWWHICDTVWPSPCNLPKSCCKCGPAGEPRSSCRWPMHRGQFAAGEHGDTQLILS